MDYLSKINDNGITESTFHGFENEPYPLPNTYNGVNKNSFLVFKHSKYSTVPTRNIAYFYIKYASTIIVTFDKQEYSVNYSLDQVQELLSGQQFYRLNRQYLINFGAVKDVEHYFARKLLVNLAIPIKEKLLVSKEKARSFLDWLENR